jgi:hypothetical protein
MVIAKDPLELVGMFCELADSLAVPLYQHIELLFRQNSELTVATSNAAVRRVSIHIAVKHSAQRHSSGLKCGELGTPHLLIYNHLQILLDVPISSHVL